MRNSIRSRLELFGPFLGLFFVLLIFMLIAPPAFISGYNLKTIVTQTVIVGIGALGMTFVIISGGIDLSVGSIISLVTIVTAQILTLLGGSGISIFAAALIAIAVGALVGLFNGWIIASWRIVPFIVTLGSMQIARGLAKWLAHEQTVLAPETALNRLMNVDPEPAWLIFAPGVWIMILLTIIVYLVLRYTVFGRYVFALGSNEQAARLCGVRIQLNRIWIYTLCGALTGVAGVLQFANLTVGDPTAAVGLELDIIAAVVIGGASLNGGQGTVTGTLVGALIMSVVANGCTKLGLANWVQEIVTGGIIVAAVLLDYLRRRNSRD